MRLFWKIYCVVFISFVAVAALSSYVTSTKRISDAQRAIVEEHRTIGSFITSDIERGQSESKWPFESLKGLTEDSDFIFWWIVDEDGTIHLADKASFIGSRPCDYFPQIAGSSPDGNVLLNNRQNYGIFTQFLTAGEHGWTFWFGFSTEHIARTSRKIIFSTVMYSASALVILGIVLYFVIIHFLRPVKHLTAGAEKIGKGELNHRVEVNSNDELGYLARSFNKMAEDLKGTTTSIDNLNREIVERKKIEQELENLAKFLSENPNPVLRVSKDGTILYSNEAGLILLDKWGCKVGEQAPERWRRLIGETFRTGKPKYEEEEVKDRIFSLTIAPVTEAGYANLYARDITERKQAKEALEVSNRELRDFVYIASHDLREPLRKISSFGALLEESLEGKLQPEDRESLEFMVDGANRMTQMISSLLEYSRIGTKEITYETVDLNEAIEQLERLELAALLEETGGIIEIPQTLPKVQADPVQIRQLLQNLITNGIKYRSEGIRPRIVIRAEQTAENAVRIEVQDNGIGIDEENNRRIFKMFKRLHSRDKYEGAGIGLAICQKIVERHGGRIGVESKAGDGSTFWFTLPVSKRVGQEQEKLISSLET